MSHGEGFVPYALPDLSPGEGLERVRQFRVELEGRRSVRDFSTQPVDVALIEEAVRSAGLAPNGANLQPWTFVLVGDAHLKAQIRAAAEEEEKLNYERRMSEEWKSDLAPLGTDATKAHITDAPYVLVVFEQVHGINTDGSKKTHYYVKESVGIAVGFLIAALHKAGLATLTHTPSPMGFLRELLGRPTNERAFVLLPIGYPAEDCQVPNITKKPLEDILIKK